MNIEQILDYQNLDRELFKLEKQLRENKNKETASQMHETMKNAQAKSVKLEEKAGQLLSEIEKVKKQYQIQDDKMKEFLTKDLSKLSVEELNKMNSLREKLSQNLSILEKNLSQLAETMNAVLSDFNKTIKDFNTSKETYLASKESYDNDVKAAEGQKQELASQLAKLEKNIDKDIMEKYKRIRSQNVFPVVVGLNNNSCGGCHVELSYANISALDNEGMLVCEHCHRIIYKK
jgi:hypothetical protein